MMSSVVRSAKGTNHDNRPNRSATERSFKSLNRVPFFNTRTRISGPILKAGSKKERMPLLVNNRALRKVFRFLAAATAVLLLIPAATAFALTVEADLSADARWTKAESPVFVTPADWRILPGVTLTVDPGVVVRVSGKITAYGAVIAGDTGAEPVVFEAEDATEGWGGIAFTRAGCTDPHSLNVIRNAVLKDLTAGLTVDRQSLSLEGSDVAVITAENFGIRAVNDNAVLCPGPSAELHLIGNRFSFASSYSGTAGVQAIRIGGMTSHVADNAMTFLFEGDARSAAAIHVDAAGVAPFAAQISGNAIDAESSSEFTDFLFGIRYANRAAVGTVAGNTLILSGKNEIRAVVANRNAVMGNDITAVSHSDFNFSPEIDVIGIESHSDDPATLVADNRVELFSPDKRYAVGLFCESGLILNNRVIASLSGSGGYIIGILQQYGTADIRNNSLLLTGTPTVSIYGLFLPASFSDDSVTIANNVIAASGSADAQGIFAAPSYDGFIDNYSNLLYNFTYPYNGVPPGEGDIYDDPLFSNLKTLELSPGSPALTGETIMGADPETQTSELPPEPTPEPEPEPQPEPQPEPAPEPEPEPAPAPEPEPAPEPAPTPLPPEVPVITTQGGDDFETEADAIIIEGTADPISAGVWVNNAQEGVVYVAGATEWSYAGPLEWGVNTFTVFSKDAAGLVSGTATIQVTRVDQTPPEILSAVPATNAQNVKVSSLVTVEFSEEMDASTLTSDGFFVNGVGGSVTYFGTMAEFQPAANLQHDTVYTVTLTTDLTDKAGNALASAVSWSFKTEPAPCQDFRKGHHYGDDRCKEKNKEKDKKK